jgi:hypothetical protein
MATYTPKNVYVYIQAFTGAVAGLLGQSTNLVSTPRGYYTDTLDVAGAWAQEVDAQWFISFGNVDPDLFQFNEVLNFSDDLFQVCDPQPDTGVTDTGSSTNPATYLKSAQALMAILSDGETYLAGLGIVVPGFGGDCCLTPFDLAAGATAYTALPGQQIWCITPAGGAEIWTVNAPVIADCPPNARWGAVDGTKGGSFNAAGYLWVNNPGGIIEDPGDQPVCTNNPILIQNPGETVEWQLDPTGTFWKVV